MTFEKQSNGRRILVVISALPTSGLGSGAPPLNAELQPVVAVFSELSVVNPSTTRPDPTQLDPRLHEHQSIEYGVLELIREYKTVKLARIPKLS